MELEDEQHLLRVLTNFNYLCTRKYKKGKEEHGGYLNRMPRDELLDNAIDEAIDQVVYLLTLKERLKDELIDELR